MDCTRAEDGTTVSQMRHFLCSQLGLPPHHTGRVEVKLGGDGDPPAHPSAPPEQDRRLKGYERLDAGSWYHAFVETREERLERKIRRLER